MRELVYSIRLLRKTALHSKNTTMRSPICKLLDSAGSALLFRCANPQSISLATIKRSTPVTSGRFDTVILPSGLPDVEKFSKAENTKFFLTGVPNSERERISFDLDQTFIDVPSGMRVAVTYPRVNNSNGTLRPRLEASGLQRIRSFATFHKGDDAGIKVLNLHTGVLEEVIIEGTNNKITSGKIFVRPRIRIMTSAMLCAKQGCGELLVAYPLTSVSTVATAPEQASLFPDICAAQTLAP